MSFYYNYQTVIDRNREIAEEGRLRREREEKTSESKENTKKDSTTLDKNIKP